MIDLSWDQIRDEAFKLAQRWEFAPIEYIYGIPQGGTPVAIEVAQIFKKRFGKSVEVVQELHGMIPLDYLLVVDDIVDSGRTLEAFTDRCMNIDALYSSGRSTIAPRANRIDGWLHFPWEKSGSPTDAVTRMIEYIGEDPKREGLLETPDRVCRAFKEMTEGYDEDPKEILSKSFGEPVDEMIIVKGIRFTSICEHHLLPFNGTAVVSYLPGERVVGLSKIARLVACFAKRLQLQERLTQEIATALTDHAHARGVGVVLKAHHSCMGCRGVRQLEAEMVTSCLKGLMLENPSAKAELLSLI